MAVAVARPDTYGSVLPFVLGLLFDLIGGGPVGAMAFSLTLFTYLVARYSAHVGNDSTVMSIVYMVLALLLVELSYGAILLLFGYNANLFEALAYRVVPCFVYDMVIACLLYPLARRFVQPSGVVRADITQLR